MISSEVAEAIVEKIKDVCVRGDSGVKYIDVQLAEQIIMNCRHDLQPEINKMDFNHLHKWLEGVDKRLDNSIEFNAKEFLEIQSKNRNLAFDNERLTYWLHQLEKKVIELQGFMLGRKAVEDEE